MTRRDAMLIAQELFKLLRSEEPFITRQEAAAFLGMTVNAVDANKNIPRYHIGKSVRFRRSELDKWVCAQN